MPPFTEGPCNPLPQLSEEVDEAKAAFGEGESSIDETLAADTAEADAEALAQPGVRRANAYAGKHQHHVFPQEAELQAWFEERFAGSGENIHEYTVYLSEGEHQAVHLDQTRYKGKPVTLTARDIALGRQPYRGWNNDWKAFKAAHANATAQEIFEEAGRLMDKYKISDAKIERYLGTKKKI